MLDNIIEIYEKYTGKVVPTNLVPQYEAWGKRAVRELENKLGWQFSRGEFINVLGVSPRGCNCDIAVEKLLPAPVQRGHYRVFNYDSKQPFVFTDPFTKVHNVYICRVEPEGRFITSNTNDVVILKKVEKYAPRYFSSDFGKYVQACDEMTICQEACDSGCTRCSAILVDADWIDDENFPDELGIMLCDYIDWMANGGISNRGIASESVDGHSISYGKSWVEAEPFRNSSDLTIIQQYAGPYGMANRRLIW